MNQKIILASTSPRRKELLNQIGLDFEIIASDYEEDMTLKMNNAKLVKTLSRGKAIDVAKKLNSGIVIGVDTFVVFDGKRLGKPKNNENARKYLKMISGNIIKIYSGISIIDVKNKKEILDYEITKAKIKILEDDEIENYIKTGEPLDKAGAFAIQGIGAVFIEKIDGCYSNVIGLPLHKLYVNLKKLGVNVF